MAKLGFLGLGIMGYPMARNLLRAGHEVALWSHNASKAKQLAEEEKGKFCATPKEVAGQAEAIFLCVGDAAMVDAGDPGAGRDQSQAPNPAPSSPIPAPSDLPTAGASALPWLPRVSSFSTRPAPGRGPAPKAEPSPS